MKGSTHITFRGDPDVEIDYEYPEDWQDGYCTGCEVLWSFSDPTMHALFTVTPEEDEAIVKRIVEIGSDPHRDDWIEER
jgi:hypothetical protein